MPFLSLSLSPQRVVLTKPPTFNEGEAEWAKYNDDTSQIVPTFDGEESKESEKKFYTWDRNSVMPIRYATSGLASEKESPGMTVTQMFKQAAKLHGDKLAMLQEDVPGSCKNVKDLEYELGKPPMRDTWTKKWTWTQYVFFVVVDMFH